ncbi:Hypothetical predicted protein [Podarcis lilfordi]|uniref:Uncharacterized protein n=1 Tax=Podarcis lilfordi TaxID=74358 RepID=A0AA35KWU2_9SAUR|nr:Hypothetical predicted protein [Podarcis lilfordi]
MKAKYGYCRSVIWPNQNDTQLSTDEDITAGPDLWYMCLAKKPMRENDMANGFPSETELYETGCLDYITSWPDASRVRNAQTHSRWQSFDQHHTKQKGI